LRQHASTPGGTPPKPQGPPNAPSGHHAPPASGDRRHLARDVAAAAISAPPALPYLALYEHSRTAGVSVQPSDFQGLQLVHRVSSDSGDWLVTYWSSRDAWTTHSKTFPDVAKTAALAVAGFVYGLKTAKVSGWKRFPVYTWVLAAATLLGALDSIGNHYEWLFARPSIDMQVNDLRHLDTVEGGVFAASLHIANQTRVDVRNLLISKAALKPRGLGKPTRLSVSRTTVSALSPASSVEVELLGRGPKAGRYEFVTTVTASAGFLAWPKETSVVQPVRIWPGLPAVEWTLDRQGDYARVDATVSLGSAAPHGIDCQLFILPHRSPANRQPILDYFDSSRERWLPDYNTPGAERESLTWHGPIEILVDKRFSCLIPIASEAEVALLKRALTIRCSKTEGG
jgi:hypothetical protein